MNLKKLMHPPPNPPLKGGGTRPVFVATLFLFLASCAVESTQLPPEKLALTSVDYADLPGWNDDHIF